MDKNENRGFSLIESAIVLAIVGLTLGGIWAAASTVTENRRAAESTAGLLQIVENVRSLYQGQSFTIPVWDNEGITETVFIAGLAPANWGPPHWSSAYNNNFPYPDSNMSVNIANDGGVYMINIRIEGAGVTQKVCNRLLREIAARSGQAKGRLRDVQITSPDISYDVPFDVNTISCPASFLRIGMSFYL